MSVLNLKVDAQYEALNQLNDQLTKLQTNVAGVKSLKTLSSELKETDQAVRVLQGGFTGLHADLLKLKSGQEKLTTTTRKNKTSVTELTEAEKASAAAKKLLDRAAVKTLETEARSNLVREKQITILGFLTEASQAEAATLKAKSAIEERNLAIRSKSTLLSQESVQQSMIATEVERLRTVEIERTIKAEAKRLAIVEGIIAADQTLTRNQLVLIEVEKLRTTEINKQIKAEAKRLAISKGYIKAEAQNAITTLEVTAASKALSTAVTGVQRAVSAQTGAVNKDTASKGRNTVQTLELANAQQTLRSSFRGAAGALGGLWLAYGQILPMVAAFTAAAGVKRAISEGSEFAQQLQFIQGVAGGTDQELSALGETIKALGSRSLFRPTEIVEGVRVLSRSGFTLAESAKSIQSVTHLAAVGEIEMAKATEIVSAAMHSYKLDVSDVPHIVDVLGKASSISATTIEKMGTAFGYTGNLSAQFGFKLEEVSALLATLAQRGITGSKAGTSLTNMFVRLSAPVPTAQRALKALGASMYTGSRNAKDMLSIVQQLSSKFKNFDSESQARLARDIFGIRSMKAAVALLDEANDILPEFISKINQSSEGVGFMAQAFEKLQRSASGEFQQALGSLQTSLLNTFSNVEPQIVQLARTLKTAFRSDEFTQAFTSITSGVLGLTNALVKNGGVIGDLIVGYAAFKGSVAIIGILTAYTPKVLELTTSLTALRAAVSTAAVPWVGLAAALVGVLATQVSFTDTSITNNQRIIASSEETTNTILEGLDSEIEALKERNRLQSIYGDSLSAKMAERLTKEATIQSSITAVTEEVTRLKGVKQGLLEAGDGFGAVDKRIGGLSKRLELLKTSLEKFKSGTVLLGILEADESFTADLKNKEIQDIEALRAAIKAPIPADITAEALKKKKEFLSLWLSRVGQSDAISEKDYVTAREGIKNLGSPISSYGTSEDVKRDLSMAQTTYTNSIQLLRKAESDKLKILQVSKSQRLMTELEYTAEYRAAEDAKFAAEDAKHRERLGKIASEIATTTDEEAIATLRKQAAQVQKERDKISQAQTTAGTVRGLEDTGRDRLIKDELKKLNAERENAAILSASEIESIGMGTRESQKYLQAIHSIVEMSKLKTQLQMAGNRTTEEQTIITENLRLKQLEAAAAGDELYKKQREGTTGALTALNKYAEAASDSASQIENALTNAFKSSEDALVEMVTTGKTSVSDLVTSMLADFARLTIQQKVTGPLAQVLGGYLGGGTTGSGITPETQAWADTFYKPEGNFASGIDYVPHDMIAQIHKGEAVIPASQNRPGGSVINIYNNSGSQIEVKESQTINGRPRFDVIVDKGVRDSIAGGRGGRSITNNFGLQPQLAGR